MSASPFQRLDDACARLLTGWPGWLLVAVVFAAGMALCGWYSVRQGAFITWDLKNYQFYAPYALLNGRFGFDYAAAQIQTFLNPLPCLPFYLAVTKLEPVRAGFAMGAFHGLSVGFLFLVCREALHAVRPAARLGTALVATALGAWGPTYLGMMGGSGSDNVTCIFVLAGVFALLRGWRTDRKVPKLVGAMLLGVAAGLKLVAVTFILGGLVATAVATSGWRARGLASLWFGFAALLGLLLSRGMWMAHLWSRYESPLFPFYNAIFKSPFFHPVNFADVRFLPESLIDALTYPFAFFLDTEFIRFSHGFRDMRYAVVYVILALALVVLLVRLRRGSERAIPARATNFLIVFFVVSYVFWQTKFAIMRYIVPLEMIAPVFIVLLLRWIIPDGRMSAGLALVAFVAIATVMEPRTVPREVWGKEYISVEAPELEDPASTMVVIANARPWSYVIPFFPPEVRFIGAWNRFSRPEERRNHQAQRQMAYQMKHHEGPLYLLTTPGQMDEALRHLPHYAEDRRIRRRLNVQTAHDQGGLLLVKLRKR